MTIKGEDFGPKSPPFHIQIKNVLGDYIEGPQIIRECIQNADDALASEVSIVLDHRTHPSENLLTSDLATFQGPSVLVYNNSKFSTRDFLSFTQPFNSKKQEDFSKIGKYGLGFLSGEVLAFDLLQISKYSAVYHWTDLPTFISGNYLVFQDPHNKYLPEGKTGVRYDFVETDIISIHKNHLEPFDVSIFEEPIDFTKPFEGTMFRLPLRTAENAQNSSIKKTNVSPSDISMSLENFSHNNLESLMFLKYVERISVYELCVGESKPTLISRVSLKNAKELRSDRRNFATQSSERMKQSHNISREKDLSLCYSATFEIMQQKTGVSETSWMIHSRLKSIFNVRERFLKEKIDIQQEKLIPSVSVAFCLDNPVDQTRVGRLFCFLPVVSPPNTNLPVHINGCFALTSSRRNLQVKDNTQQGGDWNKYLFEEVVPKAYLELMLALKSSHGEKIIYVFPIGILREHWIELFSKMIKMIKDKPNYYNIFRTLSGKFVGPECAIFEDTNRCKTVTKLVDQLVINSVVCLPTKFYTQIVSNFQENVYNSKKLCAWLRKSQHLADAALKKLNEKEIDEILHYITKNKDLGDLEDIPGLIPLIHSERLGYIMKNKKIGLSDICFIVNSEEKELFDVLKIPYIRKIAIPKSFLKISSFSKILNTNVIKPSLDDIHKIIFQHYPDIKTPEGGERLSVDFLKSFWALIRSLDKDSFQKFQILFEGFFIIPINSNERFAAIDFSKPVMINKPLNKTLTDCLERKLNCRFLREMEDISIPTEKMKTQFVNMTCMSVLNDLSERYDAYFEITDQETELLHNFFYEQGVNYDIKKSTCLEKFQKIFKRLPIHLPLFTSSVVVKKKISIPQSAFFILQKNFEVFRKVFDETFKFFTGAENSTSIAILRDVLNLEVILDVEYYRNHVFPKINSTKYLSRELQFEKDIEELIKHILKSGNNHLLNKDLRNLNFVFADSVIVKRKRPSDFFDPSCNANLKSALNQQNEFPSKIFLDDSIIKEFLIRLGLKQKLNSSEFQYWCEYFVSEWKKTKRPELFSNLFGLFRYANEFTSEFESFLKSGVFIVACSQIHTHNCFDKNYECCSIEKAENSRHEDDQALVEGILPIFRGEVSNGMKKILGWSDTLSLDILLKRIKELDPMKKETNYICRKIYAQLEIILKSNDTQAGVLASEPWILVQFLEKDQGKFLHSQSVFRSISRETMDLFPFLVNLPSTHILFEFPFLMEITSVQFDITAENLYDLLLSISTETQISENNLRIAVNAVKILANFPVNNSHEKYNFLVPTKSGKLININNAVYADERILKDVSEETVVHPSISLLDARRLRIRVIENTIEDLDNTEDDDEVPDIGFSEDTFVEGVNISTEGEMYGESLVNCLRNRILDYTKNTIFFELIQNADDAKASKFEILLDTRVHEKKETLFSPMMFDWNQGPCIWIYNNAKFSNDDWKNILNIGSGSKSASFDKIGKFGYGFTSIFHLTDVPSIISGSRFLQIDPHAKYLPVRNRTFIRCNFLKRKLASIYPDEFKPYVGIFGFHPEKYFDGTLIRVPLRHSEWLAKESKIKDQITDLSHMNSLLNKLREDSLECFTFLHHVEEIKFSKIDRRMIFEHSWTSEIIELNEKIRDMRKRNGNGMEDQCLSTPDFEWKNFFYMKTVMKSGLTFSIIDSLDWAVLMVNGSNQIVSKSFGIEEMKLLEKMKLLPLGGVAINNKLIKTDHFGNLYTFLPLPIKTGLPYFIHGNFALTTNRQGLCIHPKEFCENKFLSSLIEKKAGNGSHDGFIVGSTLEVNWNLFLFEKIISPLVSELVEIVIRDSIDEKDQKPYLSFK
ncbi:hypothetical protein HK096_006500, partial [Nowakowskiella sp. JEL0078]